MLVGGARGIASFLPALPSELEITAILPTFGGELANLGSTETLPISLGTAETFGKTESGRELARAEFENPSADMASERIAQLELRPAASLNPAAAAALARADLILVGPGSLLGSLLPPFLVSEFVAAFEKSPAMKVIALPAGREFGYLADSREDMLRRFPVFFDFILTPKEHLPSWPPELIAHKIMDFLA